MTSRTTTQAAQPSPREAVRLPDFYLITALVVAMILALAVGGISYRLAYSAQVDQTSRDNLRFSQHSEPLVGDALAQSRIPTDLIDQIDAEMQNRPVVKVRLWAGSDGAIRYSTDPAEIGRRVEDRIHSDDDIDSKLIHYAVFETGRETLYARDLIVTKTALRQSGKYGGLEIYTDITETLRYITRTTILVVGPVELLLAVMLGVVLRRRSRQ